MNCRWIFILGLGFSTLAMSAFAEPSFVMIVDNGCLERNRSSVVVQHKISKEIHYQALRIEGQNSLLQKQLELQRCLVNVSEDAPVIAASVPADPLSAQQLGLATIKQSRGENFFYHPLWGIRQPVVTAVVDTGVQTTHPDLQARLWRGNSGEHGFNILTELLNPADDNGHGTHVAGVLGAQRGNGIGIQGVMGDLVQIMGVKALDSTGGGNIADVVNGILWAADHGAEVINLSLATTGANTSMQTAIEYALSKNIVLIAAAGNQGALISNSNFVAPAAYAPSYEGLISVGSIDALTLARPNYSNHGSQYVELAAPGSVGVDGLLSTFINSSYVKDRGTSISSPHVAGAVSLIVSFLKTHDLEVSNVNVERLLLQGANSSSALSGDFAGGRYLDLERLGRVLFLSTVIDTSGGFDEP